MMLIQESTATQRGSTVSQSLPGGWQQVCFGDLAEAFIAGGTPPTKKQACWDGDIPWTTSAPIGDEDVVVSAVQRYITQAGLQRASNIVPQGSLLVGTRVGVGKAAVNALDIAINQDLTGVVLDRGRIHPEFAAFQFKTQRVRSYFEGRKRGTTIKGVSRSDLQQLPILLPPLPQQAAINQVLSAVQGDVRLRRREVALERERKAALMQHLFMYGASDTAAALPTRFGPVPSHWKTQLLEGVARVQTGVAKGRRLNGAQTVSLPYLRVANVQDGFLDLSEIKYIELAESEVDRYRLQAGDVLLTEGGDFDKLGRGFVWHGQVPDCVHQNHVFAVRSDPQVMLPEFLAYLVQSSYGKAYFLSVAHRTTNLACINSTKLKQFPALLPDLEEQERIVAVLSLCDTRIGALERERMVLEELFRAMLEELMTGRLSTLPLTDSDGKP